MKNIKILSISSLLLFTITARADIFSDLGRDVTGLGRDATKVFSQTGHMEGQEAIIEKILGNSYASRIIDLKGQPLTNLYIIDNSTKNHFPVHNFQSLVNVYNSLSSGQTTSVGVQKFEPGTNTVGTWPYIDQAAVSKPFTVYVNNKPIASSTGLYSSPGSLPIVFILKK